MGHELESLDRRAVGLVRVGARELVEVFRRRIEGKQRGDGPHVAPREETHRLRVKEEGIVNSG